MNGEPGAQRSVTQRSRRRLLQGIVGLSVAAGGLAALAACSTLDRRAPASRAPAIGEPPPETTTIRLSYTPAICVAPQYLANPLLEAEGFTDVQHVAMGAVEAAQALAAGSVDLGMQTSFLFNTLIDVGEPIVYLSGLHVGCFELFGTDAVRAIRDLKGKRVAVTAIGSGRHILLAAMAAYVGLDPNHDMEFVTGSPAEAMQQLATGEIDAFMAFPPEPQELRAKGIGHVVVNTALDRPWSQYFCCMAASNRSFIDQHPVATKRALRAVMKAADLCQSEPDRAAQQLVDGGHTPNVDVAQQVMREIPYDRWREFDPEDTVRFYALRMREVGMMKSSPEQLIARATDWRFLNELKQELKT